MTARCFSDAVLTPRRPVAGRAGHAAGTLRNRVPVRRLAPVVCLLAVALASGETRSAAHQEAADVGLDVFARAAARSDDEARAALAELARRWRPGYAAMVLDLAEMSRPTTRALDPTPRFPTRGDDPEAADRPAAAPGDEEPAARAVSPVRERLLRFLEKQTGKRFGHDFERWHRWIWSLPDEPHPDLARFKGLLYASIDSRMQDFFPAGAPASIRLDEIEWGGVVVNGIPPLVYPAHLEAGEAGYLKDDHIVFGLAINGETRAYPKRILAWHELARDRLGGVELTIVYCTLCGTVLPYESVAGGRLRRFGTSGLLYRSNKLMFDEETKSLWSSLDGKPVVGPLVGSGLSLAVHPAVTTRWGEWRRLHPETTVLSLETGHQRDYSEGAAYRDYFSTDRLMFTVPGQDTRLKNKAEVLVMRLASTPGTPAIPVAIAADFLRTRPVYHADPAGRRLVVLTSRQGANRVYEAGANTFVRLDGERADVDESGRRWQIAEEALVGPDGVRLQRISAQRAFWFGWHAQFPSTLLIK
jgi:hypothetical protein